jgi:hypothetical protein
MIAKILNVDLVLGEISTCIDTPAKRIKVAQD